MGGTNDFMRCSYLVGAVQLLLVVWVWQSVFAQGDKVFGAVRLLQQRPLELIL